MERFKLPKNIYGIRKLAQWQLVCGNSGIPNLLQSVYFGGILVGSFIFGTLGDRIGRHYTLCICVPGCAIVGIICAASPNAMVYLILRFLTAAFSYGASLMVFLIGNEFVAPPDRVYTGVGLWYLYALGYFVLAGLASLISNWRMLVVAVTVPYIIMIPIVPFISESPRWLISQKKYEAAEKIIRKIARVNKKRLSENFMQDLVEQERNTVKSKATIIDIVRSPTLLLYTVNLWFNWFVQSFVYYGLSLGTSTLGVNVYIAFCISGAVEIPAYTVCIYALKVFGRKKSSIFWNILAGVSCFCTIFIPPGYARVAVAMLGKFAITISFSNIYVHSSEIFPTPLRSIGMGTCSISSRIGGIIAPLVLYFGEITPSLPLIVFALSAVTAGLLVIILPETKGKLMPDTIEDALNLKYPVEKNTKEGDNSVTFQALTEF